MICKVRQTIEKYKMPVSNSKIVVGLSGGADSMTLLSVLNSLRTEYNFRLIACHVNHGIRGKQADDDENFVIDYCKNAGIPFEVLHADIPALAKEKGIGLEECGRQVRYEFFNSFGDCLIATAHTLSDKCETLLLNETRGASAKGLCSIPPVRGNIIRPLIDCTRAEIEAYCKENNIPYVTDTTNFDDTYARNRIRLNVIPELKKINPSFEQAVSRLTQSVSEDEEFFSSVTKTIVSLAKKENGYLTDYFKNEHPAIKRRIIALILQNEADIIPELIHIKMVDDILEGGKTEIIKDTFVEVKNGILAVNPKTEEFSEWECDFSDFKAETPVGKIVGKIINRNELSSQQNVHNMVLDCESIIGKCVLRNRRAGDKMKCAGSNCTKSIKKLFNEKHLDGRNNRLILADESGIIWIQGIGCCDRCKIKKETEKILVIGEETKND